MKVEIHTEKMADQDDTLTIVSIKYSGQEIAKACDSDPSLIEELGHKPRSPSDLLNKFMWLAQVLESLGTVASTANARVKLTGLSVNGKAVPVTPGINYDDINMIVRRRVGGIEEVSYDGGRTFVQ